MKRMVMCIVAAMIAAVASAQERAFEEGYSGNVEIQVGTLLDNYLNIGISTSYGYCTSYGLYAGIGTGIFYSPEHYSFLSVPVFADIKYSFMESAFSPFVRMRVGTMIDIDDLAAGVYCSPAVGFDIGKVSVSFSYGYNSGQTYLSANRALVYNRHTLDVGLGFWF